MCLGIPGLVVGLHEADGLAMATVDFGGVKKAVCVEHVKDVVPGEYVLVHVGFALSRIDAEAAGRIFDLLREYGALAEELEP